jgi:Putative Flp pilus-assembly TadE/G-like
VGTQVIATLRRSEEGQALVLAAIFGLVLMVCVLGTVNLGRAVYEKVQLQTAADALAYSQAALEARVMNFTAYTNRAMVVHYASLMAATSYLTWLHFIWAALRPMLEILGAVPYVGPVAATVENGLRALLRTLDAGVAALAPALCASNLALYGLQEAAWHSVWLRLGKPIQPEAQPGGSTGAQPIWPDLLPLANQAVFAQVRGHFTMPQNAQESAQMLTGVKNDAARLAQLHMLEIANSARQPWVAYGDRADDPSLSPLARHFRWKLSIGLASLQLGSAGRTELGGFSSGASQVWSAQRLALVARVFGFPARVNVLSLVAIDQVPRASASENQYALLFSVPAWLKPLLPGITAAREAMSVALRESAPVPPQRTFWLSPYVWFAPQARASPEPGPWGRPGNFAQPDVLVGLALPARELNADRGASRTFARRFSWSGRTAGSGATDFRFTEADGLKIPGLPRGLQPLRSGLHAFSAAQAYYHRPGDWREMPNLFNPLWSARLMPVLESNAAARLGLTAVPLLNRFLLH